MSPRRQAGISPSKLKTYLGPGQVKVRTGEPGPTGPHGGDPRIYVAGLDFVRKDSHHSPPPRNIISVRPFLKVRDPIPVTADLVRIRHVSKKSNVPFFPTL